VYFGDNAGGFGSAVSYGVGAQPATVAAGDFDGDGHPDLAVANNANSFISVLLYAGSRAFSSAVGYPNAVGGNSFAQSLAVGDVDGNSTLDVVTVNGNAGTVSVHSGTGSGTFADAVEVDVGPGSTAYLDALGDLNGDGILDVVVEKGDGPGLVMLGTP